MGTKRDRWLVGAASATASAGAVVFLVAGASTASAGTPAPAPTSTSGHCTLGTPLCKILNGGSGTSATPPKSSGQSAKPPAKAAPATGSRPAAAQPRSGGGASGQGAGSGAGSAAGIQMPAAPPAGGLPAAGGAATPPRTIPALPDITADNPGVVPQVADGRAVPAHLAASTAPESAPMSPVPVAAASAMIGAVTALNVSMLRRRRRRSDLQR